MAQECAWEVPERAVWEVAGREEASARATGLNPSEDALLAAERLDRRTNEPARGVDLRSLLLRLAVGFHLRDTGHVHVCLVRSWPIDGCDQLANLISAGRLLHPDEHALILATLEQDLRSLVLQEVVGVTLEPGRLH